MGKSLIADELLKKLKEATREKSLRFPKQKMEFEGEAESPTIFLHEDSLNENMQMDTGAFEGWIIALLAYVQCKRVILRWNPLTRQNQHYQRFLYRVAFFSELFPELSLPDENCMEVDAWRKKNHGTAYVNVPLSIAQSDAANAEHKLERELVDIMNSTLDGCTENQLPCGVFSDPKKKGRIFPGRSAAMDIVRVSGNTLYLYELKTGKNKRIGIVSELMFYASILRDLCRGDMRFVTHSPERMHRCKTIINALSSGIIKDIEAVFLMEDGNFHPLLKHPAFLECLNKGAAHSRQPALRFRKARLATGADGCCSGIHYIH